MSAKSKTPKQPQDKPPKLAKSARQIALALQISPNTVAKYLAMKGAPKRGPGGYDIAAVTAWISENTTSGQTAARVSPDIKALKLRELTLKCDRLAHKLETERGSCIAKSVIGPALRNAASHFRAEFQRAEQELPARLVNRTELEIEKELQSRFDKIFSTLHSNTRQWMLTP